MRAAFLAAAESSLTTVTTHAPLSSDEKSRPALSAPSFSSPDE
jgi:hypothetical protein